MLDKGKLNGLATTRTLGIATNSHNKQNNKGKGKKKREENYNS